MRPERRRMNSAFLHSQSDNRSTCNFACVHKILRARCARCSTFAARRCRSRCRSFVENLVHPTLTRKETTTPPTSRTLGASTNTSLRLLVYEWSRRELSVAQTRLRELDSLIASRINGRRESGPHLIRLARATSRTITTWVASSNSCHSTLLSVRCRRNSTLRALALLPISPSTLPVDGSQRSILSALRHL